MTAGREVLPSTDREVLLRYAVDGDPEQGALEIEIGSALELRTACRALVPRPPEMLDLLEGVDWASVVEEAALTRPSPTLDDAQPDLVVRAERAAAEARAALPAAEADARDATRDVDDVRVRADVALNGEGSVPAGELRRRALLRSAQAWAIWACEGLAVAIAAAMRADGVLDYASLADVPAATMLPEAGFGLFAAAAYFALKALAGRAVRACLARSSPLPAGLAVAAVSASILYAGALTLLRLGEVHTDDWAAFLLAGAAGPKALIFFLGIPALALWADRLSADAAALRRRLDRALAEERSWAARVEAAGRRAAEAARLREGLSRRARLPEDLRACFSTGVTAYQVAARVGNADVLRRKLAFLAELANLRAMSRAERVRWAEAGQRRQDGEEK